MWLSNYFDIDNLHLGDPKSTFRRLMSANGIEESNGEFFVDAGEDGVADAVVRLARFVRKVALTDFTRLLTAAADSRRSK